MAHNSAGIIYTHAIGGTMTNLAFRTGNAVRRLLYAFFVVLLSAFILAGCDGSGEIDYSSATIDINALASALSTGVSFDDRPELLDRRIVALKYKVTSAASDYVVYTSSGATAEEIIILEAADASAAAELQEAVNSYNESRRSDFENYNPAELTRLDSPVMVTRGRYVIYCVTSDSGKALEIIDDSFKNAADE